jgi:hypothetical protein
VLTKGNVGVAVGQFVFSAGALARPVIESYFDLLTTSAATVTGLFPKSYAWRSRDHCGRSGP